MTDSLSCAGALDLIEAIAAGELEIDGRVRAHFETCPRCASALATARRIEAALAARQALPAPARFTAGVIARIRTERWKAEQRVDRLFNLAIAAGVLLMLGGVAALFNVDTVLAAAARVAQVVNLAAARGVTVAAPSVATYAGSIGLLISALAMWWWAERRLSL